MAKWLFVLVLLACSAAHASVAYKHVPAPPEASTPDLVLEAVQGGKFEYQGELLSPRALKKLIRAQGEMLWLRIDGVPTPAHFVQAARLADEFGFRIVHGSNPPKALEILK